MPLKSEAFQRNLQAIWSDIGVTEEDLNELKTLLAGVDDPATQEAIRTAIQDKADELEALHKAEAAQSPSANANERLGGEWAELKARLHGFIQKHDG